MTRLLHYIHRIFIYHILQFYFITHIRLSRLPDCDLILFSLLIVTIYKSFREDIKFQGFIKNDNNGFAIKMVGKGMKCILPIRPVIWEAYCNEYKLKKVEVNYCIDSNTMRIHTPDTIIPHVVYWLTSYDFAISYYGANV